MCIFVLLHLCPVLRCVPVWILVGVCACLRQGHPSPTHTHTPICKQQPCLLAPRTESSTGGSRRPQVSKQPACREEQGGGEGRRLLSSSRDKSFCTPMPNFHTFPSTHAVPSSHRSHPFLLHFLSYPLPVFSLPSLFTSLTAFSHTSRVAVETGNVCPSVC